MFQFQDLMAVAFLVVMEGLLSFDNALALAAMVKHLPEKQQKRALTYGIIGAFGFRILALSIISYLMKATWIKFVGGGYLLFLTISFFLKKGDSEEAGKEVSSYAFWRTVLLVELTDIAFSIDSILAAVAVSSKLWVVFVGGVLGIIMMRFAATLFIRLIEVFPKLERSAYLLIGVVGAKLVLEGFHLEQIDFESISNPAFWLFWGSMAAGLGSGFMVRAPICRKAGHHSHVIPIKKASRTS